MKQALEAYRRWRDGHPGRHLSFLVFAGLTVAALVAFPDQDLPVLVEHDLAVIDVPKQWGLRPSRPWHKP